MNMSDLTDSQLTAITVTSMNVDRQLSTGFWFVFFFFMTMMNQQSSSLPDPNTYFVVQSEQGIFPDHRIVSHNICHHGTLYTHQG